MKITTPCPSCNPDAKIDTPCPACGATELRVEWRLEAKPIGSFSVSGAQLKVSAQKWPWLVCGACKIEARGKAGT